mmetsp:Transcript_20413/g.64226  ORF Transcript_20413/g.64226 Transcript_20413/m.64226 type:complete len:91 (-) Transcript_20413:3125-3397(-)
MPKLLELSSKVLCSAGASCGDPSLWFHGLCLSSPDSSGPSCMPHMAKTHLGNIQALRLNAHVSHILPYRRRSYETHCTMSFIHISNRQKE